MRRRAYLRPIGLSYGADAIRSVAERRAGRLGGSNFIAFHGAETVSREEMKFDCAFVSYGELGKTENLLHIEATRHALAGYSFDLPLVMGIVNVTPDSFSDGGRLQDASSAIAHGVKLAEEGAAILDVGGESTRPGSDGVDLEEEIRRVIPVIEGLVKRGFSVSCDTRKPEVMSRAAHAGAALINDVSALQYDPASLREVARLQLPVILMHAQGDPRTMQLSPRYEDVALDVFDALEARIEACVAGGIARERILIDPGIGFGKSFRHNLDLLHHLTLFHGLGLPLVVGLSRKGFIGALTEETTAGFRVHGSVGGAVHAALNGAQILRVHDVKATVQALAVALASADPDGSGL